MEFINTNDENSFDPTSKLKSSPIPILFAEWRKVSIKFCDISSKDYFNKVRSYEEVLKFHKVPGTYQHSTW